MNKVIKILTKGEISDSALKELRFRKVYCWLQNNIAVRGRSFRGELGLPDIIGIDETTGLWVVAEVKTIRDIISDDQRKFLNRVVKSGGKAFIAKQSDTGAVILEEWTIK